MQDLVDQWHAWPVGQVQIGRCVEQQQIGAGTGTQHADVGVLRPGARADLLLLDAPSYLHLAYRPGVPLIDQVLHNGAPTCPL